MSEIETELLKVAKGVKAKKGEDRQDYLKRLVEKTNEVVDADEGKWDLLSEETQNWVNAATTAIAKEEEIEDFEEPETEDEEDGDKADDSPDDDDESEDSESDADDKEDDDDEDKDVDDGDESEDDEEETKVTTKKASTKEKKKPTAKKAVAKKAATPKKAFATAYKAKTAKTDKPAKEKAPRVAAAPKDTGVKVRIKKLLIKKPSMSVDDLMAKLEGGSGGAPSRMTVAGIRAEFRHSLHVLKNEGLISIDI